MKSTNILALFLISLLLGMDANAAGSLLRIACDGDDIGAEVFINNKFKGECPIDIQVSEGMQKIRVVKAINATYEKTFNQEIRIGDGTVKKVEVILSKPQINASAQKIENERLRLESIKAKKVEEARQIALVEEERRDKELLVKQQKAADSGDMNVMVALGDRYVTGKGLDENKLSAAILFDKAMRLGDNTAGEKLADLYATNASLLSELPKEEERIVNIQGENEIHEFVTNDAFFKVPGGNEKLSWNRYSALNKTETMISNISCSKNATFFQIISESKTSDYSITGTNIGALGGLIYLESKTSFGFFSPIPGSDSQVISIEKLHGHPFPLKSGSRFGWEITQKIKNQGYKSTVSGKIICGVLKNKSVICQSNEHDTNRYSWHELSGCFKPIDNN